MDSYHILQQQLGAKSAEVTAMQSQLTQQAQAADEQNAETVLMLRQLAQQDAAAITLQQQLITKTAEVDTLHRQGIKQAQAAEARAKVLDVNTKGMAGLRKLLSEAFSDCSLVNRCLVT